MPELLTRGEVEARLGVSKARLLYWERKGWLVPALRTPGGHRRYCIEDVETIATKMPGRFTRWWGG